MQWGYLFSQQLLFSPLNAISKQPLFSKEFVMIEQVSVAGIPVANHNPVLFGGMNVWNHEISVANRRSLCAITEKLNIPYVFKASSIKRIVLRWIPIEVPASRRFEIFKAIKDAFGVPIITDVHEPYQAQPVAEVVDVIQLPAFLARQTDLVVAMAKTVTNVKPQFLAAHEMRHIIKKFGEAGNEKILLCEREERQQPTVDMLGMDEMKFMPSYLWRHSRLTEARRPRWFGWWSSPKLRNLHAVAWLWVLQIVYWSASRSKPSEMWWSGALPLQTRTLLATNASHRRL